MALSLVLDNGAYSLKVGLAGADNPRIIPNCITRSKTERRRNFIGDQVEDCKDLSGLYYLLPYQKGYLVNWDIQRQLWDYVFGNDILKIRPQEFNLVVTEPIFNFPSIQDTLNEVFFEEYRFKSILRTPAPTLSALNYTQSHTDALCCIVVDTGYSFTHIIPYYQGKIVPKGVLRIDVGGKLLTNHLKEIVSYRQLHVLDETYVMNQVKEEVCYVSQDFYGDMEIAKRKGAANSVIREYVLPDFSTKRKGFVREKISKSSSHTNQPSDEQMLRLANERFAVPEILFHPSDIGIDQMGIPEAIFHCISLTPKEMHPHLYANIILTGGCALFPGFYERILSDVRKLASDDYTVSVFMPENPATFAWQGGHVIPDSHRRPNHMVPVTMAEYKEHGHSICQKRFTELQNWSWPSE